MLVRIVHTHIHAKCMAQMQTQHTQLLQRPSLPSSSSYMPLIQTYAAFYFCLTKLTKYPFLRKKATIVSARCSYTLTYFLIYLILHYTVTMKFTIIIYILIFIIYIKNKYIKIY